MKKLMSWLLVFVFTCCGVGFAAEKAKDPDQKVFPEKVETDKNFDGIPDYAEYFQNGKIVKREADSDFDGKMDVWTYFDESGKPTKTERDTNKDGKPDAWIHYK